MKKLLLFFIYFFSIVAFAQFPENFENTAIANNATPPATGWATFTNGIVPTNVPNNNWHKTNQQFRGTFSTRARQITGITNENASLQWLVSPLVAKPVNGQVRFYTRKSQSDDYGAIYTVRYSTTSQTDQTTFITIGTWNESQISSTAWEQKFVPIPATVATGQTIYIAFVKQNVGGDTWFVDDIKVDSQCLVPTALTATPLATSASLSWTSPNPTGPWQIEYGPAGFTPGATPAQGTIVSATTNPFNLTGLTPLTGYTYYVRTMCDTDNPSPWSNSFNFTTTSLPPVCGGNFIDFGGPTANYPNNENRTWTITPTNPNEVVTVTFTTFNTEANFDALYVYDGPSTASPLISSGNPAGTVPGGLAGGYWGTAIPGPFTSSHPSGALTFVFRSDGVTNREGWTANVTCSTCPPPLRVNLVTATSNSLQVSWTSLAPLSTGYEVICLPTGSPAPTATSSGTITTSNPYTIPGLNSNTTYDVYVRPLCSGTTTTGAWSVKGTFTTLPNYCAGDPFYDSGGATGNYSNNESRTFTICPQGTGNVVTLFFNTFNIGDDTLAIYDGNSTAAPLLGNFTGFIILPTLAASNSNTTGCLTFVFTSNANGTAPGWDANVVCGPACPSITAILDTANSTPLVNGKMNVCKNQNVSFAGTATAISGGTGVGITGATYKWIFDDGVVLNGQNVTRQFATSGVREVNLIVTLPGGCRSVNNIRQIINVSTDPIFTHTISDDEICTNQTSVLSVAHTMVTASQNCVPSVTGITRFLPDRVGGQPPVTSISEITIAECYTGRTITSAADIESVCMNIEHSYLGDLSIELEAPNGVSILLSDQRGGSTNLGIPWATATVDGQSNILTPGTGYNYCFNSTATPVFPTSGVPGITFPNGNGPATYTDTGMLESTLPSTNIYRPVGNFAAFIGSPIMGTWKLKITDNLAADNGYLFGWNLKFSPSVPTTSNQFTPAFASGSWTADPDIITPLNNPQITVQPTVAGTKCYTYNLTNDFGCTYSHQVCIDVTPGVSMTSNVANPLSVFVGQNGTYYFSGGTPNAVVTYKVNNGPDLQVILDATGSATVTVNSLTVDTTVLVTHIAEQPIPTSGYVVTTTGGVNPTNSQGGPLTAAGQVANTSNSTTINQANPFSALRFASALPAGTVVTISIAKGNNAGNVQITDGANTITFNSGTLNELQHIQFTMGRSTDVITITHNSSTGIVYVDGATYTYDLLGCDAPLNLSATVTVTIPPTPFITSITHPSNICSGSDAVFTILGSPNTTVTYTLNGSTNQTVNLDNSGQGTITVTSPLTNVVLVTSTLQMGTQTATSSITKTIIVNPLGQVNPITAQTLCQGTSTNAVTFSTSNPTGTTTYTWTNDNTAIGLAASSGGNVTGIPSFVATNTTTAPITGTITVTPTYTSGGVSCVGPTETFTITVNPSGNITTISDEVVCNGGNTTAVTFGTTNTGGTTTYTWTNDNPAIGLAASSGGNVTGIPSFVATNTTTAPITGTITVTPTYTNGTYSCVGTNEVYTITVNPTAQINLISDSEVCHSGNSTAVTFSTVNTGGTTNYTWTNNNPAIGLAASSGGNATGITSFVATNTTNAPITGTITVIPTFTNGGVNCSGLSENFTITVNISGQVNAISDEVVCPGGNTTAVTFTTTNTGGTTTYTWTNDNTAIGLAASSGGNATGIPSFVATNTTTAPITGTITITPTYSDGVNICPGVSETYTITVNPTGIINPILDNAVCNGSNSNVINFSTSNTGGTTTYTWTNNNPAIGLAVSSGGNATGVPSFVATNTTNSPILGTVSVIPTFTNGGISCIGVPEDFTITVNLSGQVNTISDEVVCNGGNTTAVTFGTTNTGGTTTYTWTNNNTAIGLAASSVGNATGIPSFVATNTSTAPITGTITVIPTYSDGVNACAGASETYIITVNPSGNINAITDEVVCNGGNTTAVTFGTTNTGGTTTYTWTNTNTAIGLAATSGGNATGIPSFVATNTTTSPITGTITVTPTYSDGLRFCTGTPEVFTITVNPTAQVNTISDEVVCNGGNTTAVTFGTINTGGTTTYTWTNNNTAIGLAASSVGNATGIPSFVATNTSTTPINGTITVTPTYTNGTVSCAGTSETYIITVNPSGNINAISDEAVCNGGNTTAVTFGTTNIGGTTTYTWTNSNPAIGLAASSGGNATGIPSFVATNTSTAPITGTITVIPTYSDGVRFCAGTPEVFTITVNPTAQVNAISDEAVCNGGNTTAVTFGTTNTGGTTTYTWTNNNTAIGLAASSVGNATGIPSFVATNITTTPITGTITVTPTYTNGTASCAGASETYIITVNPSGNINAIADEVVCNGGNTTAVTFGTTNTGGTTTYTWINSNPAIGLAASSAGNATGIPSFVATNTTNAPITGTITVVPTYNNGGVLCIGASETFDVTVNPSPTLTLTSAVTTTNQTICVNSPIVPIQYTFDAGATGVVVTGLPAGINPTVNGNIVTISGTPTTTAAIFNYSITATGNSCGAPALSGTIEVTNGILPIFTQVAPVCEGATINIPTSSYNIPPIVGVWNLISSTANDVTYEFIPNPGQCALNTTMTIVVHPLPIVTPSVTTQSFCSGGTTNISLTSSVSNPAFYWTATGTSVTGQSGSVTGSGATSINQTLVLNPNVVSPGQVTYSIVAEANGCLGAPVTVVVTVNPIPNVILSPASLTQTICSGETTNISFSGAINNTVYSWSVVSSVGVSGAFNGVGTSINQTLTSTGLSQGTVVYEVTPSLNGCTGTPQRITVTVNPVPVAIGPASHRELCSGESTDITVSTFNVATVFNWTVEPNGVSGASAGTDTGLSINIAQPLTTTGNVRGYVDYIITPVLTACSGIPITVRVYVNPLPVVSLTDGTICVDAAGIPFQGYELDSGLNDVDYDFVWTFAGNTITGATSATYTATEVGTYTVVATNSTTNCVSNVASAVVTATNPATSLTVTQSEYFSDNATLVVTVTGGNGTLLYQLDQGVLQESNVFTGVTGGTHTITVVDTQGCTYLTQEVLVIDYPKYFTPNGDGHNDTWNIIGLNQSDAKLYIFDRYGKLIKQIVPSTLSNGWDGTYNNVPMPSTDYWFTLDYTENGTQKQFKAHFSLKR